MKANDLKKRLSDQQAKAAYLIVLNDFEGGKQTQEEIAQEVGITRRTLLEWRRKPDFITYQNALSDQHLESYRSRADKLLIGQVEKGHIKALDLYYTLLGRKVTKSETTQVRQVSSYLSDDEIQAELEKLTKSIEE